MSHAVITSFIPILDGNGLPYNGALVYVYDAGTTTPKTIYSNAGLSITATNPITVNANGHHGMRYVAAGTYKIYVTTASGTPLTDYSWDNIDTGVAVGSGALAIASGGTGATTAATARVNLDVPSNATVSAIAADVATLNTSLGAFAGIPQGYLTPTSGSPVSTSGVSAGTAFYYTPDTGRNIPIWNGTSYTVYSFSELTLTLVSSHVANAIYDVFGFLDSGAAIIGTGPAWNTATEAAGDRGSGAGTTELERKNGLYTNKNAITARNGSTTYSVSANQGTYLGSIWMDGTNGQLTCHRSYGQSRKWGIWNCYNRRPVILKVGDSTASWTYSSTPYRPSNNNTANSGGIFLGLAEEQTEIRFVQTAATGNGGVTAIGVAVGYNSTTAASGQRGSANFSATLPSAAAQYIVMPSIGINRATCLESGIVGTPTFNGTELDCLMTIRYRA